MLGLALVVHPATYRATNFVVPIFVHPTRTLRTHQLLPLQKPQKIQKPQTIVYWLNHFPTSYACTALLATVPRCDYHATVNK